VSFCFVAKRRREIVLYARHVGAAETEDFGRFLIAWLWHCKAKDQIWALMECAKNMGGKISEAEAAAITEEASITRKHLSADNLARFLGVTYEQREALRFTTIGSVNVGKRARKELRKRRDRLAKEAKRRVAGMRPQSESLSATKPWRELGMSRAAWYRRNKARRRGETTLSAAIFLSSEDRPVSPEGGAGLSERRCRAEERKRLSVLADGDHDAADIYGALSPEAGLLALGLKISGAKIACAA
jgi:hypothetical protein